MSKFKAKCTNERCSHCDEIQYLEKELSACPYCKQGGETWEISKSSIPWKILLCLVILAVIICFSIWRCCDSPIIKIHEPNNRELIVGKTDTLCANNNSGDSVVWTVAIGDSLVSAVAINDSTCVVKALKDGQEAVVIASLLDYPEVRDTCVYVVKPVEIVSPDTIVVKKDSIPDDTVKETKPVVDSHAEGKVIDKPQPPTIESKTATIDLGYAIYNGPYKVVNGKKVPHGQTGNLKFKEDYTIDLKNRTNDKVQVCSKDIMQKCGFEDGLLYQGLVVFSGGDTRWITIGR